MSTHQRYEQCVVDSNGNCTRWSHDHSLLPPYQKTDPLLPPHHGRMCDFCIQRTPAVVTRYHWRAGWEYVCAIHDHGHTYAPEAPAPVELPEVDPHDGARHFDAPLTVGQLRAMLAGLDDSTQVVLAGYEPEGIMGYMPEWLNVEGVALPEEGSYCAVTLYGADTYDSRQF
jgi:hypothetical protein